ncbi:hypothetical protein F4810DRAFT_337310 [Camillea tinctor]|nr:hypothetical protein F4810DRAFT_337310 [Camillea tinctor]
MYHHSLIVISGIAGDAYSAPQNTWTNQLHQQFPHALVNKYRFSQSSVRHGLHGFDLKREARFIRDQLLSSNNEDDGAGNLPIIFIARDLGVSLAKQVILLFHEDGISTKLQDRIKALFTFDTLHPAADAVRWKHYLDQLLKKYYRHSPLLSHFLSDLPETLQKIEAEFVSVSFSLKVFGLEMDIQGRNYEESTGNVPNLPWYLRFGESMLDFLCNKFSLLVMETSRGENIEVVILR